MATRFCGISGKFQKPTVSCEAMDCSKHLKILDHERRELYLAERLALCADNATKPGDEMKELMKSLKSRRDRIGSEGIHPESHTRKERNSAVVSALTVYNRLMDDDVKVWGKMNKGMRETVSMDIIKDAEETAWMIGCSPPENRVSRYKMNNVAFQVVPLEISNEIRFDGDDDNEDFAELPNDIKPMNAKFCIEDTNTAIGANYKNIQKFLQPSATNCSIVSNIMGVSLGDLDGVHYLESGHVFLRLYHPPKPSDAEPKCVFISRDASKSRPYGIWDDEGCTVLTSAESYTECRCNHLTNFAILMDFTGSEFSASDEFYLSLVSLVFSGLSTVGLLLTIILYLAVKSLRNRRNTITFNLAICLLFMNILVQTGLKRFTKISCYVISVLLQYFVLAAFLWMLMEGALLYQMVILVFETTRVRMRLLHAAAYGIPIFIITVSSAVRPEQLIREKYCWPSSEKGMVWSVIGPIVLVILVNMTIFAMTLNAAIRVDIINKAKKSIHEEKKNVVKRLKGMVSLTCILGITWAVAFFYVPGKPAVSAFLFVSLNGLQGVFLFATQMLLNTSVRQKLFIIYKQKIMARLTSVTSSWRSLLKPNKDPDVKVSVEDVSLTFTDINLAPCELNGCEVAPQAERPKSLTNFKDEDLRNRHPFGINQDA